MQSLVRRSATLFSGEMLARVLGIVLYAALARILGVDGFGAISFAMTVGLVTGVLVDFGQSSHATRVIATDPRTAFPVLRTVWKTKLVLTVVCGCAVGVGFGIAGFPTQTVVLAVLMSLWAGFLSIFETERASSRALGQMKLDATANATESLLRLVVVVLLALVAGSAVAASIGFILEAIVSATGLLVVLRMRRVIEDARGAVSERSWTFLATAAPAGVTAAALAVFYRIDQMFVQGIAGSGANGLYGAAARVAFTANVGAQLVTAAAYPELAAAASTRPEFTAVVRQTIRIAGLVSLVAAASVFLLAKPIIVILYGRSYAEAVPLLRILSITVLFNGISAAGLYSCLALRRERTLVVVVVSLTLVIALGYLVAVRAQGATGAAVVSAVAEPVLAASLVSVLYVALRRTQGVSA